MAKIVKIYQVVSLLKAKFKILNLQGNLQTRPEKKSEHMKQRFSNQFFASTFILGAHLETSVEFENYNLCETLTDRGDLKFSLDNTRE